MTYFVNFGLTGFFGIFFAALLFALVIHRTMMSPCSSLKELLAPFPFSKVLLLITELFLLVLYSAMLSASSEVLLRIFNINRFAGTLITAAAVTLIILKGYNSISDLSEVLFIPIVIIIFIISLTSTEKSVTIPPPTVIDTKAFLSPVIYVSYNMLTTIPLLITIPDKYMYRNCGNQVGIVIFILSAMLIMPLYTHYSDISSSTLPLMELLNGRIKYLYEVLLMLAIFSTAVSAGYALLHSSKNTGTVKSALFINFTAVIISFLGFNTIVNKVYFIFGIPGILSVAVLFLPSKIKQ